MYQYLVSLLNDDNENKGFKGKRKYHVTAARVEVHQLRKAQLACALGVHVGYLGPASIRVESGQEKRVRVLSDKYHEEKKLFSYLVEKSEAHSNLKNIAKKTYDNQCKKKGETVEEPPFFSSGRGTRQARYRS